MTGEPLPKGRALQIAVIVSNSLDPAWGSTTHIVELSTELGRHADVRIYLRRSGRPVQVPSGTVFVPGSSLPVIGFLVFQARLLVRLLRDLSRSPPDVLYSRYTPFGIAPACASVLLGIPHVIELNGIVQEDLAAESGSRILMGLARVSERLHCTGAARIVAVSDGIADDVARRYGRTDTVVVANGVNCSLFRPVEREEAARALGLSPDHQYICFVGNLASWQGVDVLLEAAPRILAAVPSARLLIVGDGDERDSLGRRANELGLLDACIFTGSVPYSDVPIYINASTICVAPFVRRRNERTGLSPLKVYEYLACARPVVASGISGVSELIGESGGGRLVPPEDTAVFAATVSELLGDEQARVSMGRAGREWVVSGHCWSHVADEIIAICETV